MFAQLAGRVYAASRWAFGPGRPACRTVPLVRAALLVAAFAGPQRPVALVDAVAIFGRAVSAAADASVARLDCQRRPPAPIHVAAMQRHRRVADSAATV